MRISRTTMIRWQPILPFLKFWPNFIFKCPTSSSIWSILIHCHEENPRARRAARIIQGTLESRLRESDAKWRLMSDPAIKSIFKSINLNHNRLHTCYDNLSVLDGGTRLSPWISAACSWVPQVSMLSTSPTGSCAVCPEPTTFVWKGANRFANI